MEIKNKFKLYRGNELVGCIGAALYNVQISD